MGSLPGRSDELRTGLPAERKIYHEWVCRHRTKVMTL
jgi:hypothetical protein